MNEQLFTLISTVTTAVIGYLIWNLKDRRKRQHEHDKYQDSVLNSIDTINRKMDSIVDIQKDNAEGISLCLESDIIQFRAFRKDGLLNGDSEKQEDKINQYMLSKSRSNLEHKELLK